MSARKTMGTAQEVFLFPHAAAMSGHDFIVSDSNRDAVEWLGRAQQWNGPAFVLYGPQGCGKSHLCRIWEQTAGAIPLSAADLDDEGRLADRLQAGQSYFIDDVDRLLADHPARQHAVFHLYNFLKNNGGYVLLTSRSAPRHMPAMVHDLESRLRAAQTVAIHDPDDRLLESLLVKLFDDRQLTLRPDVVKFMVPRIDRSYAALIRVVEGLDAYSLAGKRAITVPLVREWFDTDDASA